MHVKGISFEKLADIIDEKEIPGGKIMPSLAQRLTEQGKREGITEGKLEGILEGRLKDARKMHEKGFSLEDIIDITELSEEELKKAGIF